jgi:hypothetical protein
MSACKKCEEVGKVCKAFRISLSNTFGSCSCGDGHIKSDHVVMHSNSGSKTTSRNDPRVSTRRGSGAAGRALLLSAVVEGIPEEMDGDDDGNGGIVIL